MSKLVKKQGDLFLPWSGATVAEGQFEDLETDFTILQELGGVSGVVSVDALIQEQWRRFIAFEMDEQSRSDLAGSLQRRASRPPRTTWKSSRPVHVVRVAPTIQSGSNEESIESENNDWVLDPMKLLQRLERQGTTVEERRIAVLFAETTAFSSDQLPPLLNGLAAFIDEYRFSTTKKIVNAVGSAIRKFGMNMPPEQFPRFAAWFGPSETETISHDVELELVKAVVWRLSYQPVDAVAPIVELLESLRSLATDYLTPRLVLQKNYAAIALNATIATVLLASQVGQNEVAVQMAKIIREINIDWFQQQVMRRLKNLSVSLRSENAEAGEKLELLVKNLF
ncbi:MAG: hypothetical protein KF851_15520 [Pirellulaceae bacterium]|nr:hypothetical protein [Pirellulaceae bacterium]